MSIAAAPSSLQRRAARAVRSQFFVAGALFATWGVQVPAVKAHYGLGEGELAWVMLAAGGGALGALPWSGRLIARLGSRRLARWAGWACAASVAALLAFDHPAPLLALMLAFGAATGWFDVAVNAQASELETASGRSLMSGFHGLFSLGGMAGAALGAGLAAAGMSAALHLAVAAALGALAVGVGGRGLLPATARPQGPPAAPPRAPRRAALGLGLLAAVALVAEGAMYDWSVLYLRQSLQAGAGLAPMAYAAFSLAMAAGRFSGNALRARWPAPAVLVASGGLATFGLLLALATRLPAVALAGFALVGLGLANVVPLLFSAAARLPGVAPADGIAAVSSFGYLGLMAGPPLIGFVAQRQSLGAGLAGVAGFTLLLAVAAPRALRVAR